MAWAAGWRIVECVEMDEIQSDIDHAAAIAELRRLWGAASGTPAGDRLDRIMVLVDAYETEHHTIRLSDR